MTAKHKGNRKPRMPVEFVAQADAAIARHRKRGWVPDVLERENCWECPYSDDDKDRWWALIFEVLGTRQTAVVDVFWTQLCGLLGKDWNADKGGWITDEKQIRTLLAMMSAMKPRNEAEAAYAAQLCALHISAMKLGGANASSWGPDPRTAAVLNKTVRAYGDGLLNLQRLQGKGRKSVQVIKVETHRHDHKHIHLEGVTKNGEQPDATGAKFIETSAPLPGENAGGKVVPLPSREEQEGLSDARRRARKRGAKG
jgi:hypothetical protein